MISRNVYKCVLLFATDGGSFTVRMSERQLLKASTTSVLYIPGVPELSTNQSIIADREYSTRYWNYMHLEKMCITVRPTPSFIYLFIIFETIQSLQTITLPTECYMMRIFSPAKRFRFLTMAYFMLTQQSYRCSALHVILWKDATDVIVRKQLSVSLRYTVSECVHKVAPS